MTTVPLPMIIKVERIKVEQIHENGGPEVNQYDNEQVVNQGDSEPVLSQSDYGPGVDECGDAEELTTDDNSSRKRLHEEEPVDDEEEGPIKIRKAADLFEPEGDDSSTHTATSSSSEQIIPTPVDEIISPPPSPTSSSESSNLDDDWLGVSRPSVSIANAFEFSSAPVLSNPHYDLKDEIKYHKNCHGPKLRIPPVAHYNAHDPDDEVQYIAENKAKTKQFICDHDKIRAAEAEFDPEGEEPDKGEINLDCGLQRKKVYEKYDFTSRLIPTAQLAVNSAKEKILTAIENHRVVIIDGFTGCGKTTQVPQFILDQHYELNKDCNIVVTQPRKIAAISVAQRVCEERNWKIGQVVGYQVAKDVKRDNRDTKLTYMTTGTLLEKLIATKSFHNMTHIIVDEVHERDLHSDLLLLVMKKILLDDVDGNNKNVKLILMSATIDAAKFSTYFPILIGRSDIEEAPIIKIPHTFRHCIEEYYLDDMPSYRKDVHNTMGEVCQEKPSIPEELYDAAVQCIVNLDQHDQAIPKEETTDDKNNCHKKTRRSVLVFLPGMENIDRLSRLLTERNKFDLENDPDSEDKRDFHLWDIIPLHSKITADERKRVFERPRPFFRKIILSTNIAESSITVPDVAYVIDFCLTKSMCIEPDTSFTTLRVVWASVNQCIQRKGRTGRVCDGKVFRLVTKEFFSKLPKNAEPEMQRSNLETVVLRLKKLNLGTPTELLSMALDPPDLSGIERAVATLKELGALTIMSSTRSDREPYYDTCDGDLTYLGSIMCDLPIHQQCTRLIMLGYCFGVMREAIIIAASLTVKNPFCTPFIRSLKPYLSKLNYSKETCSDLFTVYHVYTHWCKQFADNTTYDATEGIGIDSRKNRATSNERLWERGASVQLSALREIKATVDLITERLAMRGLLYTDNSVADEDKTSSDGLGKDAGIMLKLAIAGAFYPNYFQSKCQEDAKSYERCKSREVGGHDLCNTVFFRGFPPGHDGRVYAKFISDYLSFGLNVPAVRFDGKKVYATFDPHQEKMGSISKGIYLGIKRKQNRDLLQIPLTSPTREEKIMKDWEDKLKMRTFRPCPAQIALPGVDCTRLKIRVVHTENPGQFWINYYRDVAPMEEMGDRINQELVHMPVHINKIVPTAFYLAPFEGRYYRAKIILAFPNAMHDTLVFFVDYGNMAWVRTSTLLDFSPSMVAKGYDKVPCLAVECRLAKMKPASIYGAVWHDRAITELKIFSENAPFLFIEVYSVSNSIIAGALIGHDHSRVEQNFNKRLVDFLGLAQTCEENALSEFNRKVRNRINHLDSEEIAAHNMQQIGDHLDFDFVQSFIDKNQCIRTTLDGPYSPLELKFRQLCNSSNTKKVKIDSNSVNSIVLESEPTAPISRFLVASTIDVQDSTGDIMARDTTIMPPLPGMLSLMAMLFSPKMELRVDIRQTTYTGVLCGLGPTPGQDDVPIYMDHDLEIVFDTAIRDCDIDMINNIRHLMNLILRDKNDRNSVSSSTLSNYQKSVRAELLKLLQTQRQPVEEVSTLEEYAWNQIDEGLLITPKAFKYQAGDIFAPHDKVRLQDDTVRNWRWEFAV